MGLRNLGQGILQRLPAGGPNKPNPTDNIIKTDNNNHEISDTEKPLVQANNSSNINNNQQQAPGQQQQQRNKLKQLANLGRNGLQAGRNRVQKFNQRRRNSQQERSSATNNPANDGDDDEEEEEKPDPHETMLALHQACSGKSEVQAIKFLVARHPNGAAAMKEGNLPLHTACARLAPATVIEYLLEAYPEGTGVRNKRYKLPIHVALECGASLEVIKLLVKADPESLQVADYDIASVQFQKVWIVHKANFSMGGKAGLPLHYACKYLASLHVIHFLITEFPDAARTKNKDGWLPVHYSCARGAPLQVVQYLMTACPSSLYERTLHYYEYPMHLAAGRMNANINVVKYIQSRHSIACTQTKPNEGLYLTYYDEASMQSAPPKVVWFLAEVCAKASNGYAYVSQAEDPYN